MLNIVIIVIVVGTTRVSSERVLSTVRLIVWEMSLLDLLGLVMPSFYILFTISSPEKWNNKWIALRMGGRSAVSVSQMWGLIPSWMSTRWLSNVEQNRDNNGAEHYTFSSDGESMILEYSLHETSNGPNKWIYGGHYLFRINYM